MKEKFAVNLFPAKEFWYCNTLGWSAYVFLDAASGYLHTDDFYGHLSHSLLTTCLGILFGLGYRYLAHCFRLHYQNPLLVIPLAALLAIIFGYIFTLIDYALLRNHAVKDIVIGLIVNPKDYWWFPFAISQWIGTSYLLLIWLLLFNFIQAERYDPQPEKAGLPAILAALVMLYIFNTFFHALVTIAYYNPEGFLFSADFFVNNFYILATGTLFATSVLLFRAQYPLFDSYLILLLPSLGFLIFCTSFFCMLSFRLLSVMDSLLQGSLIDVPRNIAAVFTGAGQLWLSKHEFIGTLRSQLDIQAVIVLLFMYFRYPYGHFAQRSVDAVFDFKIWLQFWAYNIGGWSVLGCYLYFSDLLNWQSVSHDFARIMLITLVGGGVITGLLMRSLIRRFQLLDRTLVGFSLAMLLLSLVLGLLLTGGLWLIGYVIVFASNEVVQLQYYEHLVKEGDFFIPLIAITSAGCLMWIMVYEKSVAQRLKNNHQIKQLQLEKNYKELQLNLLAGKVDPHFIFNALNNIRALIREDTEKARESILALSDILRMPLASGGNKIPLLDELTLARNYIQLCKIQLESRLLYTENIDPTLIKALIPPMFLQILIENAIKHGISQLPDGGELVLEVYASSGKLHCILSNNGSVWTDSGQKGFGLGLNNIRERLQLLYGADASFSLSEKNEVVFAILMLPLEYSQ
jgi:two-component system LytT family sensor kinase